MSRRRFLKETSILGAAAAAAGMTGAARAGQAETVAMPAIRLGDLEVSRLVLGSNPFWGYAHQPGDVGRQMREYYTDERIMQTLDEAARFGVSAVVTPPSPRWNALFRKYLDQGGKLRIWIAQPHGKPEGMKDEISQCIDGGARAAFIQGERADAQFREGGFDALRAWLEHIKKLKVPAGLASHRPDTHPEYEERRLPTDFYFQCVYRPDAYRPEDRDKAFETIQAMKKPVVAYKVLAAGRNDPKEAFGYAFSRLAAKDGVCVGVFPKDDPDQVEEDATLAAKLSAR